MEAKGVVFFADSIASEVVVDFFLEEVCCGEYFGNMNESFGVWTLRKNHEIGLLLVAKDENKFIPLTIELAQKLSDKINIVVELFLDSGEAVLEVGSGDADMEGCGILTDDFSF